MSFAMGFAKGAAETVNERIDENRSKADEKRKYYRNLMYEQALPAYYKKKQKAGQYRQLVDSMADNGFGHLSAGQRATIVNRAQGDPTAAYKLASQVDMQKTRQRQQGDVGEQVSSMRGQSEPQSALEGAMPQQGVAQPETPPQVVSGTPRGPQGEQSGPNFFGRMLGQEGNSEIRNEIAKEIQSDLGLDEQTFSGMMEQAFTPYVGLENTEPVEYRQGLTENQQGVLDNLLDRIKQGDSKMDQATEREVYSSIAAGDIQGALEKSRFYSNAELEDMKGGGSSRNFKTTDWRAWQRETSDVVKNRFGSTNLQGQFVFMDDVNEEDMTLAQGAAQDHIMRQRRQNPGQPPSISAAVSYGIGAAVANEIALNIENAENPEQFIEQELSKQRDPMVREMAREQLQQMMGGQISQQEEPEEEEQPENTDPAPQTPGSDAPSDSNDELEIGHEEDGYRYTGGDPAKASSWEKVE